MTDRSTLDSTRPDDLAALNDEPLAGLHNALVASFDAEHANSAPNVGVLETLAVDVTAVRAEADNRGLTLPVPAATAAPATTNPVLTARPYLADVARRSPRPKVTTTTGHRTVSITAAGERERQVGLLDIARGLIRPTSIAPKNGTSLVARCSTYSLASTHANAADGRATDRRSPRT